MQGTSAPLSLSLWSPPPSFIWPVYHAGLAEEDAELLVPPVATAPETGKADAAWEENSEFPDMADAGSAEGSLSNGNEPADLLSRPTDAEEAHMPGGRNETDADTSVSVMSLTAITQG
jgi:hypothetical protein